MSELIKWPRSIIPACDVETLGELTTLVQATCDVEGVGAYKVGLELVIPYGLINVVQVIRRHSELPIIYDHQKAGNDIPEIGINFARAVRKSGIEAVILFPFSSPLTEIDLIKACRNEGLIVLVGGHMTHGQFLEEEGGFIANNAPLRIYGLARSMSVTDFVMPGNKPEALRSYRDLLEDGSSELTYYAPGFISQGGDISEAGQMAGERWHAIVGRALTQYKTVEEIREAAIKLTSQIIPA